MPKAVQPIPPEPADAAPQADRRRQPRRRVIKTGRIVFGDFRFAFDCTIRDLTETGARLQVSGKAEVPESFYLFQASTQTLSEARVVWRKGQELGVTFTGAVINVHQSTDPRLARFRFA